MLPAKIAFVDIETSGGSINFDRIIEIGIIRFENNTVADTYQTLINPECHISPFIEGLTGISSSDLENAPPFWEVKDRIHELLEGSVFVAHNVRFDYSFIKNEFRRCNIPFSPKHFCTVKLSRALFPRLKHHNLDSIIERFEIVCRNRHRAYDDAAAICEFYQKVQTQFPEVVFEKAINFALRKPSRPIQISEQILDSLPECPGVYIFYAKGKTPLYIGKSINIRDRVLSHFASDHASTMEMSISQQVEHIETIPTSGELAALFKESTLIKTMQPLYNKRLRLSRKLVVLKKTQTKEGYDSVEIDTVSQFEIDDIPHVLGVFRSKKQAREFLLTLSKEHMLCQKILGIEKTKRNCFGYHLGSCRGGCMERENPLAYNTRFLIAFSKSKIKNWPFDGPIFIKEENLEAEKHELFLIDKWCHMGSFFDEERDFQNISQEYLFDYDTYKILVSYLNSAKNLRKVIPAHTLLSRGNLQQNLSTL